MTIVECGLIGCDKKTALTTQTWHVSQSRDTSILSGGKWIGADKSTYYRKGDTSLCLTIILGDEKRFEFESVNHIYVNRLQKRISKIQVASFGYSKTEAVKHLERMHEIWDGQGLGEIKKWISDTERNGGLRGHDTVISESVHDEDPTIIAGIYYNFGGKDDAWYIMTSFIWPDPRLQQLSSEKTDIEPETKAGGANENK